MVTNTTKICLKEAKKKGATTILITECEECVEIKAAFIDEIIGITVSSPRLYKRTLLPEIILVGLLDVIYNAIISFLVR
jgi:DNA-binding MurR/RpiR family transcriptional regulator